MKKWKSKIIQFYLKSKWKINESQKKYFGNYIFDNDNPLSLIDTLIFLLCFVLFKFLLLITLRYSIGIENYRHASPIISQIFWIAFLVFVILKIRWKAKHIYIYCLAQIAIPILMSIIVVIIQLIIPKNNNSVDNNIFGIISIYIQIISQILMIIIFFFFIPDFQLWFKKAFSIRKYNILITLVIVIVGYFIMMGLNFGLSKLSPNDSSENQQSIESLKSTIPGVIGMFISAVLIAPIYEEIIYRYYVSYLSKDSWFAIIASILLFSLAHVEISGDFEHIFLYMAMAIVNATIYWYFKNPIPGILIHFISNLVAFILIVSK